MMSDEEYEEIKLWDIADTLAEKLEEGRKLEGIADRIVQDVKTNERDISDLFYALRFYADAFGYYLQAFSFEEDAARIAKKLRKYELAEMLKGDHVSDKVMWTEGDVYKTKNYMKIIDSVTEEDLQKNLSR